MLLGCGDDGGGGTGVDAGAPSADAAIIEIPDAGDDPFDCTGSLCGTPAICCEPGTDCVSGECLPACDSGTRCGSDGLTCCNAGEVCIDAACAVPGDSCLDSYDCVQPGEFCEPTLGQCLPQPATVTCEIVPTFSALDVTIEKSFTDYQVISIPVIGDVDGDDLPEVVVNATRTEGGDWPRGRIVILDGTDIEATPQLDLDHDPTHPTAPSYGSHGRSTIALGDVNGDGNPDIIYAARPGDDTNGNGSDPALIVAIDHTGALLWTSKTPGGADATFTVVNGAITTANFDSDPETEIVVGGTLLDHDGTVVWELGGNGPDEGTNNGYTGGIALVAELDGDATPEIVTGRRAWDVVWDEGTPADTVVSEYWNAGGADGYPAVADLDSDGAPEVVLVSQGGGAGTIRVLEGTTGELWCGSGDTTACANDDANRTQALDLPGGSTDNRGGPPTIADFDGDGRPEIGVAGGHAYVVADVNRPGEVIERFGDDLAGSPLSGLPPPGAGALYYRWMDATQDESSNATGSSVFDFQGDGAAEVVYQDECYVRVYSGVDGTVQLEEENSSGTIHEYPLVVDVDADGNSEIVITANSANSGTNCGSIPSYTARDGVYVLGDSNDQWVPTRRVWTQHTYHVTNAESDGNVPATELDNWLQPGLNNYRQNVQGDGVFNAPDLGLDLSVGLQSCNAGQLVLLARVTNLGALGIPAGVDVEFFEGTDATGTSLGATATATTLLPGESEVLSLSIPTTSAERSFFAQVDGGSGGAIAECDESNNSGLTTQAGCPVIE